MSSAEVEEPDAEREVAAFQNGATSGFGTSATFMKLPSSRTPSFRFSVIRGATVSGSWRIEVWASKVSLSTRIADEMLVTCCGTAERGYDLHLGAMSSKIAKGLSLDMACLPVRFLLR